MLRPSEEMNLAPGHSREQSKAARACSSANLITDRLSAHHNNTDGRSGWMIFDELFKLLSEELHASAPLLQTIQWGKETMRLPMDPHVIWDAYPKKKSEPVVNPDDEAKNTASPGEMVRALVF